MKRYNFSIEVDISQPMYYKVKSDGTETVGLIPIKANIAYRIN